jgi:Flp pilus assembly protein protease CpaA
MTDWFRENASIVWSWAALIVVTAIIFAASHGTQYQQLGVGLLTASIALLVCMAVFEAICWTGASRIGSTDEKAARESAPPKHRRRGQ